MLCDCDCDSGESCDVYRDVIRKARKPWVCCECGEGIEPGTRYEHVDSLFDGHWQHVNTCLPCAAIRDDLCPCGNHGELRETIWYSLGFNYVTGEDKPDWAPRSQP